MFIDGKSEGKLDMSGKVKLGVPKSKVKSTPAGSTEEQDKRGEDSPIFK